MENNKQFIESVPDGWRLVRLKSVCQASGSTIDKKIDGNEQMVNLINYVDVYNSLDKKIDSRISFMKVTANQQQRVSFGVKIGDIIMTPSSETAEDIGQCALVTEELDNTYFSYHVWRLRFDDSVDNDFKRYLLNADSIRKYWAKNSKGTTRKTLNRGPMMNTLIPLPDLATQQRIAAFLDAETGKVDNLVDELTKFKGQLQTQRKSLISECVTKGVPEDRDREYKDSGLEWLGEIPLGWNYGEKLGLLINIISGFPFPSDSFNLEEKGYPLVRIRDIVRGYTETYADVVWEEKAAVSNGDILVGMDGDFNVAIWESEPALLNQRACKVEGNNSGRIFNKFLYYALPTHLKVINDLTYATTVKHLSGGDIKAIKMPVPPLSEQQKIADYLDSECAKIDSLISEIDNQIGLLKTYRKSLINEVVTGKIEV